jgi:gas vesicle protein
MSDRNGNDFGSFLSGFVIGGLIGTAVALLMAPQSGEETRKLIRDRGIELRDRTTETLEEAASEARARADELTKMAKERANELRGQVSDLRARGEAAIDAAKKSPSKKE